MYMYILKELRKIRGHEFEKEKVYGGVWMGEREGRQDALVL